MTSWHHTRRQRPMLQEGKSAVPDIFRIETLTGATLGTFLVELGLPPMGYKIFNTIFHFGWESWSLKWHPSFRMEQFISTSKMSTTRSHSVLGRLISTVQAWQNVEIRKNVETSLISKHNIFLKWHFWLFRGLISDWERRCQMIWNVKSKNL